VVAGSLGARGARRARRLFDARRKSKQRGIDEALSQAKTAEKKGDGGAVAAQLERALYLAIERATALKARAVLLGDLPAELERHGVPGALAAEVGAALSSLETLRFSPDGAAEQRDLAARATTAIQKLNRLSPPPRAPVVEV
jgi:hypothetical protein